MPRFFDSLNAIEQFISQLDSPLKPFTCRHCHQSQAWVSHGFVYRQRSSRVRETIGKRLFCSDRYGKKGCGRTVQLYRYTEIPARHYTTSQVFLFLSSLLAGLSVCAAYRRVAGRRAERQGWRWLTTLFAKLSEFRRFLQRQEERLCPFAQYSKHRQLLLSSLQHLFISLPGCACAHFQLQQQRSFF